MKHVSRKIKDKYEILGVIGEGAYGIVLKARKKDSDTFVAIKHFKQNPGYCTDIDVIDRELKILQSLRFENVVELIEWFREKKQCFLIFEYVEWNMLQVLQKHSQGLPLEQVRQLSYQLFSAIHWCHIHEIIHRDIKPENLLISKNFTLKLCDFGFARFCNTQASADYYTDYVATRWYRSPELLIGSAYGKPVDIWACGCIMAELTTGQALFAGESDIDQLYRIQKCLGLLPGKYLETMRTNPKFEGLKLPSIHHLETLERRFAHLFPTDIMHLFKNALRLYAVDRLTAEECIHHDAFIYLNKRSQQKRSHRQHRSKTVLSTVNSSENDHNSKLVHFPVPSIENRSSKWFNENGEVQVRHRSPRSIDNSIAASSSISQQQQIKYRSNTQMTDHSSPSHRHQSRTHSPSSDEQNHQSIILSPRSLHETSDDDDNPNTHHNRLRRKYIKIQSSSSLNRQQSSTSPTLRYASNGVLLRPKQQQNSINVPQTSSNDMSGKFKRFSLDQHQIVPEANIYRSSVAFVPNHNSNVYTNQNPSVSYRQQSREERTDNDVQRRPKTRDSNRSRTVDCHPTVEIAPNLRRTSARQTVIMHHQMVPDSMNQGNMDSMGSTAYSSSRSLEQQQQQQQQQNNKYQWNCEQRKPIYGSDSYLLNSNGHNSSFSRPFYSPAKIDYTHANKIIITPRDSNHDPIKSNKLSSKQHAVTNSKTPTESNRKQQSNSMGADPYARTAILHVANAIIPSFNQRQQSIRFPNTKSRHQDH